MFMYRDRRGTLDDSMKTCVICYGMESVINRAIEHANSVYGEEPFNTEDVVIDDNTFDIPHIGWLGTYMVRVKRCGNEVYDTPQCIGYVRELSPNEEIFFSNRIEDAMYQCLADQIKLRMMGTDSVVVDTPFGKIGADKKEE